MNRKIAIIGLGYVGLPICVAFSEKLAVVGFDINEKRIRELRDGYDCTQEVPSEKLTNQNLTFTSDEADLQDVDFYIVAVPTPINDASQPDLTPLLAASKTIARTLNKGDIVVYESTVYPGATEEDCSPVLEQISGLSSGKDFFLGYSPERINPGDKVHTFESIKKVVSGQNPEILDIVASVYAEVVTAGVHKVSSIKVAEAAKVIENSQRDLNIAFVNELAKIFQIMGIDTNEVLDAAASKWNFIRYQPGLVGGHCIGVDPYYLTYKAQKLGYHPEVLLAGRRINDGMSRYLAEQIIKAMLAQKDRTLPIKDSVVVVLGVTFKENCPDVRNSKIFDVITELRSYGLTKIFVHDPWADAEVVKKEHGIDCVSWDEVMSLDVDTAVVAVGHSFYRENTLPKHNLLVDVKGIYPKDESDFRL